MDLQQNTDINVISLFSGCGGLDLGVANATREVLSTDTNTPFNFIWSNDVLEHACKSYSQNFNKDLVLEETEYDQENVVFCGDIRNVSFNSITKKNIDLILGGFPCQDFSILRGDDNRQGVKVQRGRLYLEFVRSLAELQPKMFVAENVQGLTSANDGKAYKRILKDFTNLSNTWSEIETDIEERETSSSISATNNPEGYTMIHTNVVDFSTLGVPQARKRLVMIGLRNDLAEQITELSTLKEEIESSLQDYKNFEPYPLGTMEAFEGSTLTNLQEKYKETMKQYEDYVDKLESKRAIEYRNNVWPQYTFDIWSDYFWRNTEQQSSISPEMIVSDHTDVLQELGYWNESLDSKEFEDGSNEEMREQSNVLERLRHIMPDENHQIVKNTQHHVTGMMSNIYRRIHPLEPSKTIIASGGGGTWGYHYERERGKLTNRERARLQGFPDDYLFTGNNSEVRKQIGNAVPPLGAKRIGEQLILIFNQLSETNN